MLGYLKRIRMATSIPKVERLLKLLLDALAEEGRVSQLLNSATLDRLRHPARAAHLTIRARRDDTPPPFRSSTPAKLQPARNTPQRMTRC